MSNSNNEMLIKTLEEALVVLQAEVVAGDKSAPERFVTIAGLLAVALARRAESERAA